MTKRDLAGTLDAVANRWQVTSDSRLRGDGPLWSKRRRSSSSRERSTGLFDCCGAFNRKGRRRAVGPSTPRSSMRPST
jgi:hypothetical protein